MSLQERLAAVLGQLRSIEDDSTWYKANGASQAQMQFIIWIGNHPGCRLQQIASGLGLTAPTVSVGVQRLEQAGLLQRASDERDQRALNLELTSRGLALYTRATDAHNENIRALLERLKPNEQRQLVDLLERCLNGALPAPQKAAPAARTSEKESLSAAVAAPDAEAEVEPKQLDFFGG